MLASAISSQILVKYGAPAQAAYDAFINSIGVVAATPLSAEDFAVKIMEVITTAESSLPDNQKQNNFGYSIGEGGAYRANIKAVVGVSFSVVA